MKALLIIDHFGSGGAQRQMAELACGLSRHGHQVEMFVYYPEEAFFAERIAARHITVHAVSKAARGSFVVMASLVKVLRRGRFDVAVSFLNTPSVYAEICRLVAPRTRLVVSERSSFLDDRNAVTALLRRLLHALADQVVANSEAQASWLRRRAWLRGKVACIYNGVNLEEFGCTPVPARRERELCLLGVGRIGPEKNLLALIAALGQFAERFGYAPQVDWAGARDTSAAGRKYCAQVDALLERLPVVHRHWRWLGVCRDIPRLLLDRHALVHPSLYEGSANAICEALASGRPVLASRVCDHPLLVAEGKRGYLFDPDSPAAIADALARLADLAADELQALGRNAREYAVMELGVERMVGRYEALCASLCGTSLRGSH